MYWSPALYRAWCFQTGSFLLSVNPKNTFCVTKINAAIDTDTVMSSMDEVVLSPFLLRKAIATRH